MPTLLQINSYKGYGSIGKIAEQIAVLMRQSGWKCYIAAGRRYSIPTSQEEIRFDTKFSEFMHWIKSITLDRHGLGSKMATKRLIRKIDAIRPDVIHIHNVHGYYLNYPLFFEYLASINIPIVWTLHDCWTFTGHCSYFEHLGCNKWKTGCRDCSHISSYPKSLLIDNSKTNFNKKKTAFTLPVNITIVAVSEWLSEYVNQSFLNKYPVRVIHNGIDLNVFRPINEQLYDGYGIKSGKFVILGVAAEWNETKGLDAFVYLSRRDDCQVVVVGVTESQKQKLPSSVIAVKRTNNQRELAALYSRADVFVNPTVDDNFPTVNLEALACGTPVVTYRTGGCPEAVDENTGIVVEKGDVAAMENAIETVRMNGKQHYSELCRQRAEKLFNKDERFAEYADLYAGLLK